VEIKHGRIAMLAIVGHLVTTAGVRLSGDIDGTPYSSIPTGIAALSKIPQMGLIEVVAFVGFLEVVLMKDGGKGEYPGDLRNGMFKWSASPEEQMTKRGVELNNGRAAQMGILGLMFHEQMSGEPYILNSFLGYSTHFNEGLL
jgi:hypothetical protein